MSCQLMGQNTYTMVQEHLRENKSHGGLGSTTSVLLAQSPLRNDAIGSIQCLLKRRYGGLS